MVVVLRVLWLCVVPRRWWVWWQGLVVVEFVMVLCGDVCYVEWAVGNVHRRHWHKVIQMCLSTPQSKLVGLG